MNRRLVSFLLAVIMLFSTVPVTVLAQTIETNAEDSMAFIDDAIWLPEGETPDIPVVETGEWVKTEQTDTKSQLVCQDQEHSHSDDCYEAVTLIKWVVALKEDTTSAYAAENGIPIHFFVTSLEEAQDPYGDYENYKADLWGKNNGGSTDTVGAYATADILDGETGEQIQTRNGIRANMSEDDVIKYVAQWPNGTTADDFRKFTGNIRIGGVNYSGDEYEVQWVTICWRGNDGQGNRLTCYCGVNHPHIHIDGILTKKIQIQPGTIQLTKRIDTAQSTEQTFNFKLYQLELDTNYRPTDNTIGNGVDMVATIPANGTTATIMPVDSSAEFGFGYYKLVEQPNDRWYQSSIEIGTTKYTTSSPLYIWINTDGSVQYSTSYSAGYRTANSGATLVNSPIPTMDISVSKVWDDRDDQDGIRPDELVVHLLQNNAHYGTTLTLNAANNWQAQWEDIPVTDAQGNTYSYHIEEVVPTGYTASISGSAAGGFVLTNSHTPATTVVHARKIWNDDNNRDGVRATSITLQLYKALSENESKVAVGAPVTVSAANGWATAWENLPAKEGGVDIIYSVQETTVPNGYTVEYGKDSHTGELLVTNSHELERTSIQITKTWDDNNDQDGIRPDSLTLKLFFDGTPMLDASGNQITLTVTPGAASDAQKAVFSADAKTSTGIVVPLTATVSANGNTWTITISNLLKHVSGHVRQETVYSFGEAPINGYTMVDSQGKTITSVTAVNGEAAITNKHTPETVNIPVVKEWADNDDQDGIRPDSITVTLFANGTAVKNPDGSDRTLTITSDNSWTGTFEGLPVYQNGTPITYTVQESAIDGYTMTDSEGNPITIGSFANGQISITNEHTPETISLTVTKQWDDQNNNDGKRPYAVEIELLQNGVKYQSVKLAGTATNLPLTHTWDNLPRYANGAIITYTVVETGYYTDSAATTPIHAIPDGYYVDHFYSTQNPELFAPNLPHPHALVVNKYTPAVVSLNIQKVWDDDNNRDGLRPESLTFQIWKTTDATAAGKIPSTENGWTALNTATMTKGADGQWWDITVNDLPKYENQQLVYYSATEIAHTDKTDTGTVETATVPEGYEVSYELDVDDYILTVKNSHTVSRVDITVSKEWDDENNQDGKRPTGVEVTLYANGIRLTSTGTTVELNAQNNWTYQWNDLLEYYNGKKIIYTVVEKEVENYTTTYALAKDDQQNEIPNSWIITNSHEPELISIPVTKVWVDDTNRDGVRPAEVTVQLFANGTATGKTIFLNAANLNKGIFTDLPKYSGGTKIVYTVKETYYQMAGEDQAQPLTQNSDGTATIPALSGFSNGYTATVTGSVAEGYTITNTHTIETIDVTAKKVWNDNDDADSKRPSSVTFHLIANLGHLGEEYKAVLSATSVGTGILDYTTDNDGNWNVTWKNLPKYDSGNAIDYTVMEEAVIIDGDTKNYIASYARVDGVIVVTNTRQQDTTNVTVRKVWDDDNNRDGVRPTSITVSLMQSTDGETWTAVTKDGANVTATLTAEGHWYYTWTDLALNSAGDPIQYKAVETDVPDHYLNNAQYPAYSTDNGVLVITNSHELERTSIQITKTWDDNNDQDGIRPDSLILKLFFDGTPMLDASGNQITLTVTPGAASDAQKAVFSADAKTSTGIVVPLTATVSANGNTWTITISNLLKHVSGHVRQETVYSFGEAPINGYTMVDSQGKTISSVTAVNGEAAITNKHTPETVNIPVVKEWADNDDQDGLRPDSITVSLMQRVGNGNWAPVLNRNDQSITATLTVAGKWANTFTGLPKYKDGQLIQYKVVETAVPGYNLDASGTSQVVEAEFVSGTVTLTNEHTPETISLTVTKQWDDQNNNDGARPYAVEIELLQNGVKYRSVKLAGTATNLPLSHTWNDLPRYANGTIITYTVVETGYYTDSNAATPIHAIPDGYYVDHFYSTQNPELFAPNLPHPHALVVNKYTPAVVSLNIQKVWDDDNNRDGLRPESLTFQIWKTTDATAAGKIPSAENGWTALNTATMTKGADGQWWDITVNDLPKYEDQKLVYYSATEISHTDKTDTGTVETATVPEGYEVSYELDVDDYILTVKNSHTVSRVDITVSKEWDDENDQDGKRPDNVQVTLYANGIRLTSAGTTAELNEQNGWTHKWDDLLEYYNGKKIVYTVVEKEVEHYTTSYALAKDDQQKDIPNSWIITNSHETELISIPVNKIWEDDANRDGVRPDSITVSVFNGSDLVDTLELSVANNWSGTTVELPKYSGGTEIVYTVKETYYQMAGEDQAQPLTQNSDGTATIPALSGFSNGYTATVTGSVAEGYTITNTRASETVTVTAVKEWNDDNDRDGKRPTSITLHLIANGVHMGESYKRVVTADANGNWTATWENLYKYNDGNEIIYTISEEITTHHDDSNRGIATVQIEDYTPSYVQDATTPYHWTVINTYVPETTEIIVTKIWNDGDNRDGLRPTSVDIKLVRVYYKDVNGEQVEDHREDVETVTLSETNSWTYSWTALPKFENGGDLIVYQVEEPTIPTGYNAVVAADDHLPGYFIITNTHVPETTGISVTKLWADEENNDGKRPDGIIVQLFVDDTPVTGTKVVLSEVNDWTQEWNSSEQLPLYVYQTLWDETEQKYVTSQIRYDVKEIGYILAGKEYTGDPEDYGYIGSDSKDGYVITITNTRATEKVSVSVEKVWVDQDNNDGIRPEEVTLTLLKDGTAIQTVKLSKDNQWKHTWTDLYKYQGGVLVEYTVEETAVTGYTATYAQAETDPYRWTVINTHTIAEQAFAVQKVWKDNGDLEGLRPKSVTVQIYKNGTAYGDKITLSAQNEWKSPVSLPVYENGEEIQWTIKELEIPRYYTVSYDQTTLTVTNTIQSTEVPKTGDFNNLWMWVLMFTGCMTGAVTVLLIGRKKKES